MGGISVIKSDIHRGNHRGIGGVCVLLNACQIYGEVRSIVFRYCCIDIVEVMESCLFWVKSSRRKIKCSRTVIPHNHLCIKCSVSCYKTSTYDFIAILQTCTIHHRTQRYSAARTCDALFEAASAASRMACIVFEEVWNAIVARSKVRSRFLIKTEI